MDNNTTFKVRVYMTEIRKNAKGKVTSYRAVWRLEGQKFHESFKNSTQADAFRSSLVTATKSGEPFDKTTGLPVSWRAEDDEKPSMGWYEFARKFTDMKWPDISANHRAGTAYMLSVATFAMLAEVTCPHTEEEVRTALRRWGFNTKQRDKAPEWARTVLAWVADNSEPVSELGKPATARALLNAAMSKKDGTRAAASTCRKHLYMLGSAMRYAIELNQLETDPIKALDWEPPTKANNVVDRRSVVNPHQAQLLLDAVEACKPSGKLLKPFFAAIYYSGLRPEEAVNVRKDDRILPATDDEWGEFYLTEATPDVGRDWTDSGETRDKRGLKHRDEGESRTVPIPPQLVAILRHHEKENGLGPDGRIFFGVQRGVLSTSTILRVWGLARADALTEKEQASPLATHPYDLRHACLSTWLNAGVSATQVAEWAGNSPTVLGKVYAKCLTGQGVIDKAKISAVLSNTAWRDQHLATVHPLRTPGNAA